MPKETLVKRGEEYLPSVQLSELEDVVLSVILFYIIFLLVGKQQGYNNTLGLEAR